MTAAYFALALVMTWPLIRFLGSFVAAGTEDGAMSVWTLWWMKFSIIELGQNPLNCQYLFYPEGTSVIFHSIPKVLAVIGIPLQYLFGLTTAYNLIFLLTFAGSGLAAYFLILHFAGEKLPAFLGGAFFAFCPYRWGQWSHLALLSTMMIPVYVLMVVKGKEALDNSDRRAWLFFTLAGVALGLQSYDTEHYTIFLLVFSGLYLLFYIDSWRRPASLKNWIRLMIGQALAVAVSAIIYSPVLIAAQREVARKGDYVSFPIRDTWPGADLLSFIFPDRTSWYFGDVFRSTVDNFTGTETSFLGWTALLLALIGIAAFHRQRIVWFWAASALVFAALALGPYLVVNGEMKHVAGPFLLLQKVPLLNSTRVPVRFSLMAMLSVSVLAGYGISYLLRPLKGKGWALFAFPVATLTILALMFVEYRPTGMLTSTRSPIVYEEIAGSGVPGSVISVPLGWEVTPSGAGHETTFLQLYQPVHERPMIGGMVARAPKKQSVRGVYTPVLDFLAEPETFEPTELDRDAAVIDRVMNEYQIAFIVVHKKWPDVYYGGMWPGDELTSQSTQLRLDQYITSYLGMERFEQTDEYVAYRRR